MRVKSMRLINFIKTVLLIVSVFTVAGVISGQDNKPIENQTSDVQRPADNKPKDDRAEMFRQLGLSKEQFQQIRRLNAERKPLMDGAQKRLREANRSLDEAIYADNLSDTDFQARLKEFQMAQAEVARIRSTNELAVRRILTPDQLTRFRELRQRFEQAVRQNIQNSRPLNGDRVVNQPFRQNVVKNPQGGGQLPARPVVRPNQPRPNM